MPNIKYVTIPEYQPSSATIAIGDFYKTSGDAENISVKRAGLDIGLFALLIPVGLVAIWLLTKK